MTYRIAAFMVLLSLAGCAHLRVPSCPAGSQPAWSESLYFGRNSPDGVVSSSQWQTFLDAEVTPRFRSGFTTWKARGQWQSPNGTLERERSFVLNIVHEDSEDAARKLSVLVEAYRRQFHQQAVLRTSARVCAQP